MSAIAKLVGLGPWLTEAKVRAAAKRAGGIRVARVGGGRGGFVARLTFTDPWASARFLVELEKEEAGDPAIHNLGQRILAVSSDARDYAANVQAWVEGHIEFRREEGEQFQSGRYTMASGVGDCDCQAKLVRTLLRVGGVEGDFVFLTDKGKSAPRHVYVEALLGGVGVPLETTVAARFGEDPLRAAERLGVVARPDLIQGTRVTMGSVPATGETVEGVDLASYAGNVNWPALGKQAAFAFIRTGDGLGKDSAFAQNWPAAKAAGVIRGAYQFFRPSKDPVEQADLMSSQLGDLGVLDLPPVIDVELTDGVSGAGVVQGVGAWIARIISNLGVNPIVYTMPGLWDALPTNQIEGQSPLWVANWGVKAPNLPRGWTSWDFWQYRANVTGYPGVPGDVDVNVFNGSRVALEAYAAKKVSPPLAAGGLC